MDLDLRSLQKLQRDTGFNIDFLEKTFHFTNILSAIFGRERTGKQLTLKGGTALNFIYLDIPWLSVDLDLNFTGALEKQKMLEMRPVLSKEILNLGDSMHYMASQRPGSYILERYILKYKKLSGLRDSVRLEINFLERAPFMRIASKTFEHIFEFEKFRVNTYTIEEIAAMKTKAMVERLYARDIFDMYHISRLEMNDILLRKLMILYILMAGKEPDVDSLIAKVEKYSDKEMIRAIKPFLRREEEDALNPEQIKKALENFYRKIFVLDDSDFRFLESLKSGKLDLKNLFGKIRFNPLAEKHPGLMWALKSR